MDRLRRGWLIATIALGLTCAAFAFESLSLKLFDSLGPGPGFFPFWLGLLGTVMAAGLVWQLSTGHIDLGGETVSFERAGVKQVAWIIALLAGATVILDLFGFRPTMLVLIAALLFVTGIRSVIVIAVFAIAGSFGIYHVFSTWLKVPLPIGPFGL